MKNTDEIKFWWQSSYDRGLDIVLLMWAKILKEFPNATLDCCYGWDLFVKAHGNNPERMAWKDQMDKKMEQKGITHHGRIGQAEMKVLRKKMDIWIYPTYFTEINCHPMGTFVKTNNGDKAIESLSLSDKVLSSDGIHYGITAIRSRDANEKIYKVNIQCGESFSATGEHPVLCIKATKNSASRGFKELIKGKKEWVLAKDLKKYDIVISPKIKKEKEFKIDFDVYKNYENNNFHKEVIKINNILTDEKIWWFGYFIGDGNASNRGKISCLVANTHKERDLTKVINGFKSFGIEPKTKELNGCLEVYGHSYKLSKYLRDTFYDSERQKVLPDELVFTNPDLLLDGLLSSDGSINRRYKGNGIARNYTSKSRKLISSVRELIRLLGFTGKIHSRTHERGCNSYCISWVEYKDKKINFYLDDDNFIYSKVKSVDEVDFEGKVYNIDVDKTNNYLANGIVVHNCIGALECQKDGVVPCVINLAALKETVGSGVRVEGDIYSSTIREKFLAELFALCHDKDRMLAEKKKGQEFAKQFDWTIIANNWIKEFE